MEQNIARNLVEAFINGEINYSTTIPLLSFSDDKLNNSLDILTPGDFTILFGPSGCGKSRVAAFIVRQLLLKETDKCFKRFKNDKKYKVVFIDTEMSINNILRYFLNDNFHEYASKEDMERDLMLVDRFSLYSFSSASIDESHIELKRIAKEQEKYLTEFNVIFFIDNLGSFTEDLNSSSNNRLIKDLKATLSKFTALTVMHSNFKESSINKNNATGALGSSAEKIGQTVLQVFPLNESGRIKIKLKKSKTQDDRRQIEIGLFYEEINGKVVFQNVSQSELLHSYTDHDKNDSRRTSDEQLSNIILSYLNKKSLKHVDRLRSNLALAFPSIYKKSAMYSRIDAFVEQGTLKYDEEYLFHKDETPF
jgi:hypothetical protein